MDELILQNYISKLSNVDAEKAVLGAILLEKNSYYANADGLFEELFTNRLNQYVYRAIKEVVESGSDIDIVTISQQCRNAGYDVLAQKESAEYRLIPYVASLTNNIASSSHIQHHIDILNQYYMLRKIQLLSIEISQQATGLDDPTNIIAHINSTIVNLININDEEFDKTSAIQDTLEGMELNNVESIIKSHICKLDEFIFGFELSDLIIIAGAASMGKTAFMLRLVKNFIDADMHPAVFSLEMNSNQLISRLLSMESNISLSDIRRRNLSPNQWKDMNSAASLLGQKNFIVDDKTGNLYQIANKIRKYHIKYGTKLFFVDYLQLVKVDLGKRANREQEVATISRTFKELCRELKIIIFALSQLSRDVSKRTNHRPQLSDLRESGAIEQDADFVLFPYRPSYYDTFETSIPYKESATLIIAKGRGTGMKDIPMEFISSRTNYLNGSPSDEEFSFDQSEDNKPDF